MYILSGENTSLSFQANSVAGQANDYPIMVINRLSFFSSSEKSREKRKRERERESIVSIWRRKRSFTRYDAVLVQERSLLERTIIFCPTRMVENFLPYHRWSFLSISRTYLTFLAVESRLLSISWRVANELLRLVRENVSESRQERI